VTSRLVFDSALASRPLVQQPRVATTRIWSHSRHRDASDDDYQTGREILENDLDHGVPYPGLLLNLKCKLYPIPLQKARIRTNCRDVILVTATLIDRRRVLAQTRRQHCSINLCGKPYVSG
jgi:hypothetical protein